ncbi:MAG: sigma-54 factor interaction domain-containing protein, partial [Desulfuromonadales bacterium]|nr:sigma-54 factor interaction domain-containing protein [Desulfuromonadales bacterium]NIS41521.1 sigma-54 factor interaction domain-containing protein [Desulfuromonadales bacterium]
LKKVLDMVTKVAVRDTSVLISGESGTGKELIAHAIHYNSPRRDKRFMAINCGALP